MCVGMLFSYVNILADSLEKLGLISDKEYY